MNIIELIRGDLVKVQGEVRQKCEEIAEVIKSEEVKGLSMGDSMRKILIPVLEGLGIPFYNFGDNTVFVCYDADKLKEYVDLI